MFKNAIYIIFIFYFERGFAMVQHLPTDTEVSGSILLGALYTKTIFCVWIERLVLCRSVTPLSFLKKN